MKEKNLFSRIWKLVLMDVKNLHGEPIKCVKHATREYRENITYYSDIGTDRLRKVSLCFLTLLIVYLAEEMF